MDGNLPGQPPQNNQDSPQTPDANQPAQGSTQDIPNPVPPPQPPGSVPPPQPPGSTPQNTSASQMNSSMGGAEEHKGGPAKQIILLAVVVVIAGALLAGAYFMMNNSTTAPQVSVPITSPTPEQNRGTQNSPTSAPTPSVQTLIHTTEPITDLALLPYTVTYTDDWTLEEESTEISSTVTLTKDEYTIEISQAPTGGNACIFEGELPLGPASDYREAEFTQIAAGFGSLRRVAEAGSYSFCQENAEEEGSFFLPTSIGFITYITPEEISDEVIAEMDDIVASITTN